MKYIYTNKGNGEIKSRRGWRNIYIYISMGGRRVTVPPTSRWNIEGAFNNVVATGECSHNAWAIVVFPAEQEIKVSEATAQQSRSAYLCQMGHAAGPLCGHCGLAVSLLRPPRLTSRRRAVQAQIQHLSLPQPVSIDQKRAWCWDMTCTSIDRSPSRTRSRSICPTSSVALPILCHLRHPFGIGVGVAAERE
jgi:hypothetical protein